MTPEETEVVCEKLRVGVDASLAELVKDGWTFADAGPRFLMGTYVPVLTFRNGEKTVCFIVTPTDPSANAFKRSAHYDLVYYSEDVADNKQSEIYRRDRAFIERFASWLTRWDPRR